MEKWKDIKGFEQYYEVSNLGRVKSKDRYSNHNYGGLKLQKGKLRNPTKCGKYLKVDLYPGNKQVLIHRLVAEHFIDNPHNYDLVLHGDNNPHNNTSDNLRWGTYSMNAQQCVKDNRHKGYENGIGKRRNEI
jgi:hypothetical protein